ncbi:MAG: NADH:flavin oxidoreductase/NADH oxidase [Gammaproteobacteria bacterium]|nr:NADH:flavin oxidoreductase/NADH oxidase [Gammaproteobacteria bacterium]MCP5200565.1 NADH:flavin oxidoreductase/NADH oxidase [Gammaproteobacteria bacterium]
MASPLFTPLTLRGLTLANRIAMSPMLMYMAEDDGCVTDRHFVHYGARALGGCGLVMSEVVAVEAAGRISHHDLGLWHDDQVAGLRRVVDFVHDCGGAFGVQLAHAGRKAKLRSQPLAPSALPYADDFATPAALRSEDIERLRAGYRAAARRALAAGVDLLEIHAAHGYLLHSFLAPLSNRRDDAWGGSLEGRARLVLEVVAAVREVWPAERPLAVRLTALDFVDGGVTIDEGLWLAARLVEAGVDLLDVTTGNLVPGHAAPVYPGYQVQYAERVRAATGCAVATVGSLASADLMEEILGAGRVDLVCVGRELIRNPNWPIECARRAGVDIALAIPTYARATGPYERGF